MAAPGIELVTIETWLYGRLAENAVGVANRIYADVAPRDSAYPLVIYQLQTPSDVMTLNGSRIMTAGTWIVKAVMQTQSFSDLSGIAELIDGRLHRQRYGTVGSGSVLVCVREGPFKLVETLDGLRISHLGGRYLIEAK